MFPPLSVNVPETLVVPRNVLPEWVRVIAPFTWVFESTVDCAALEKALLAKTANVQSAPAAGLVVVDAVVEVEVVVSVVVVVDVVVVDPVVVVELVVDVVVVCVVVEVVVDSVVVNVVVELVVLVVVLEVELLVVELVVLLVVELVVDDVARNSKISSNFIWRSISFRMTVFSIRLTLSSTASNSEIDDTGGMVTPGRLPNAA